MESGRLNERITRFFKTNAKDQYGANKTGYKQGKTFRGDVIKTRGTRNVNEGNLTFDYDTIFYLRSYISILEDDILKWQNKYYVIDSIIESEDRMNNTIVAHQVEESYIDFIDEFPITISFYAGGFYSSSREIAAGDPVGELPDPEMPDESMIIEDWYDNPKSEGNPITSESVFMKDTDCFAKIGFTPTIVNIFVYYGDQLIHTEEIVKGLEFTLPETITKYGVERPALCYKDEDLTEPYTETSVRIYRDTTIYTQTVKDKELADLIESMPSSLKNDLVFWWNPKYHELTTEDIAENHTLKDLSGNGLDMTIVGSPVIAESGLLKFAKKDHPNGDGLKNASWDELAGLHILDGEGPWSIIWSGLYDKEDIDSTQVRLFQFTGNLYVTTQVDATAGLRCYCRRGSGGSWRNMTDDYVGFVCMTSGTGVNDGLLMLNDEIQSGLSATVGSDGKNFVSGLFSTSNSASYDSLFESMIMFKRQLTEEEVQWIKDNMIEYANVRIQTVDGRLIKEEKVKLGYKYKLDYEYDVQGRYVTDKFYLNPNDPTTEITDKVTINGDTTIYCTTIAKVDKVNRDMPETLRSAKVVWYNPKYQDITKAEDLGDLFGLVEDPVTVTGDITITDEGYIKFDDEASSYIDLPNIRYRTDSDKREFFAFTATKETSDSKTFVYIPNASARTVNNSGNNMRIRLYTSSYTTVGSVTTGEFCIVANGNDAYCGSNMVEMGDITITDLSLQVRLNATDPNPYTFKQYLCFNRELTPEELDWANKTFNLNISPESLASFAQRLLLDPESETEMEEEL